MHHCSFAIENSSERSIQLHVCGYTVKSFVFNGCPSQFTACNVPKRQVGHVTQWLGFPQKSSVLSTQTSHKQQSQHFLLFHTMFLKLRLQQ